MAQTVIKGVEGAFSAGSSAGFGAKISRHVARINFGLNDITGFGSNGWEEVNQGLRFIEWSADGHLTKGTSLDQPLSDNASSGYTVTLTYASGCTIGFNGFVNQQEFTHDVRANGAVRFSGRSSGSATFTWATT